MGRGHSQHRILASFLGGLALVLVGVLALRSADAAIQSASAQGVTLEKTPLEMMQELDDLIVRYQAIQLDAAFLASPGFRSLKDFSITIPRPTSVGRPNPFAPLPGTETTSAASPSAPAAASNTVTIPAPLRVDLVTPDTSQL